MRFLSVRQAGWLAAGLACSAASPASAASSGDVVCASGDIPFTICTGAGSVEFAYARAESVNGTHYVDVTVYEQPLVCDVRCHLNIQWAGGGESFKELPPMSYPSHDVPSAPTLLQFLCFCK